MNLQHHYMRTALVHIQSVRSEPREVKDAYVGLCHEIPALILTNGLVQTAAYVQAKSGQGSGRERAFDLIRRHMAQVLAGKEVDKPLDSLLKSERVMLDTLTLLNSWVYYKRFAVSYLEDPEPQSIQESSDSPGNVHTGTNDAIQSEVN